MPGAVTESMALYQFASDMALREVNFTDDHRRRRLADRWTLCLSQYGRGGGFGAGDQRVRP
jgi:hypothetical protein